MTRLSRIWFNDHPRNPANPASINGAVAEQRAALEHYRDGRRDACGTMAGFVVGVVMMWLLCYFLGVDQWLH